MQKSRKLSFRLPSPFREKRYIVGTVEYFLQRTGVFLFCHTPLKY